MIAGELMITGEPMLALPHRATDRLTTLTQGAQVLDWRSGSDQPVIWVSGLSSFEAGVAIRGGIPLCLPWFGGGPSGDLTPKHGTARISDWEEIGEHQYRLAGEPTDQFPHAWQADFSATADAATLTLRLTLTNPTEQAYAIEELAHTYLAVSDIRQVQVTGLEGVQYADKVPGAAVAEVVQSGPITFTGETDRIYASGGPITLHDPGWDRRLTIETVGAGNTVVWNPWIDKAAAMADFGDDEWTGMVCLESGNVAGGALQLDPGASHTLEVRISLV